MACLMCRFFCFLEQSNDQEEKRTAHVIFPMCQPAMERLIMYWWEGDCCAYYCPSVPTQKVHSKQQIESNNMAGISFPHSVALQTS